MLQWEVCGIAEVETQSDLSAMNEGYSWAKELPARGGLAPGSA